MQLLFVPIDENVIKLKVETCYMHVINHVLKRLDSD